MTVPWDLVIQAITFVVVVLLAITSAIRSFRLSRSAKGEGKHSTQLYEDEDGAASPESQAAYTTKVQNVLATIIAIGGLGVSLANAIQATKAGTNVVTFWLHFGLWVCVQLH
jgi:hypothetical protein